MTERHPPGMHDGHLSPHDDPERWLGDAISRLLESSGLRDDERLYALAGALVVEALQPYWHGGRTPSEAHDALLASDPELAGVVAAVAPVLLHRTRAQEEARQLIASVEASLGIGK